ncbi:MAG TPA: hypothetical protein VND92_05685 [Vicinamibacterales bacterium]|nr:hypothetical protein [Vicinamibacterales bacterium]
MPQETQERLVTALLEAPVGWIDVTPREQALLRYADKLTRTPAAVNAADIEALREAGLDDRAIHDAAAVVAYFAFVNRIASGLGVELETGEAEPV